MSMHPSLRSASKMKKVKSVLSRQERIKEMIAKGKKAEDISGFNLPKLKVLKIKISKKAPKEEKTAEEEQAENNKENNNKKA